MERIFLDTAQASGWLSWPDLPARPGIDGQEVFVRTRQAALARGFVPVEAQIIAHMAHHHALCRDGSVQGFAWDSANLPGLSLPGAAPDAPACPPFARLQGAALGVYAVVDSAGWIERVLAAGVRTVQLRLKDPHDPALRSQVRASIAAANAAGAQLFINDHWQLAIEEGAYGVHLGQEDLAVADLAAIARAGLRLGVSTHAYWEVCRAWALRPSYIACGPIHATRSKDMPWTPQGTHNLAYWRELLQTSGGMPVVGIAGMDAARIFEAGQCRVAGAAVITAITQAASPERAVKALQQAFEAGLGAAAWPVPELPTPTLELPG